MGTHLFPPNIQTEKETEKNCMLLKLKLIRFKTKNIKEIYWCGGCLENLVVSHSLVLLLGDTPVTPDWPSPEINYQLQFHLIRKGVAAWISYEAWVATGKPENCKDSTENFILTEPSRLVKKKTQTTHIQVPLKFASSLV